MMEMAQFDKRRTTAPRQYEPKNLNPLHHEILRLSVLGHSQVAIAEELNCTPATVGNAINSGLGRQQLQILSAEADGTTKEIAQKIKELAPKALSAIAALIDSDGTKDAIRLRAATDLLDRAGYGAVKKLDVRKTDMQLTLADLDLIKQRANSRGITSGSIDTSFIDVTEE